MNGLWELIVANRWELLEAVAAHLVLVVEAVGIAAAMGVPLGVAASRSERLERGILAVANALQTVPSLAMLGFLLIVFQGAIGKPPALAALVVYAVLPIVKNTTLGLRGIDAAVRESAAALGLTGWQRLLWVELPLAVPSILSGVRLAMVASVGMAAIAALIGAEGLGRFIFRGVSLADLRLIWLGAAPAAVVALACDAALDELERRLDPLRRSAGHWAGRTRLLLAAGLAGLTLWGLVREYGRGSEAAGWVRVGSKDSAEPILLGHMLAELIEAETGRPVDRRLNLGGTLVCFNALERGGLDVYVEYTGTALTTILGREPVRDAREAREQVARGLSERGIRVMSTLGFENTFAILMRREHAQRLGIRTISDLARHAGALRAGFGPEFMSRPDGYPGLVETYGLRFASTPLEMDRNLLYEAVRRGTLDVAAGDSTDGRVEELDLVVLEDDRSYFPPYEAVPLVRASVIEADPRLADALNRLAGRIDAATMRRLNAEVDGKKRPPREVAREFLREQGFLGGP
ncbi:MAG: glycine betaine/L-proline ABC transporter permease/substrate-binding protein [Isosphaeraceae bacterium]|jgi:osmoprotectant transport system permease protein|nr:MAG: glycine betaine/L-proline ABC transporter permease/substrate-binding protein [Isosphaeraceae bacterium]